MSLMMFQRIRYLGHALVCISLISGVAVLAHADEPTAADKTTARELFAEGLDLRASGNHKGALEKFRGANALVSSPITALEVGREFLVLGQLVEASEKFIEAANMPLKSTESPEAKKAREEADKLAEATLPRIPFLTITIVGVPRETSVSVVVDDHAVSTESLKAPRRINPGKHHVVAKVAGAPDQESDVTVKEGEKKTVSLTFPEGSVPSGGSTRFSTLTIVGFGVAGAGIVVGSITGLMAISKKSSLDSSCPSRQCPPDQHADVDSYNRIGAISTVSFVVAGIGATVGVVGMLLSGPSSTTEKKTAGVTPWIGWGTAGVSGAF